MWCWDTIVEMVVGTGIAEKHRAHQWRQEVERAGERQERRAARDRFLSARTSPTFFSRSDSPFSSARSTRSTGSGPTQNLALPYKTVFGIPPGSVRPRPLCVASHGTTVQASDTSHGSPTEAPAPHEVASSTVPHHQDGSADEPHAQPVSSARSDSASPDRKDQTTNQGPNKFEWVGFGRFRHVSTASPEWIKAKLDNELTGPGAFNFFGNNGLEFPHPLEGYYLSRQKSAETNGTPWGSVHVAEPTSYENAQVRLRRKFRTENSITIDADGCIIQRGFEIGSRPPTPESLVSHPSSDSHTFQAQATDLPTARKKPQRRITWDEQSINGHHKGDLANAESELDAASQAAAALYFGSGPPLQPEDARREIRNSANHKRSRSAQGAISKSITTMEKTIKVDAKVQIVSATEAEDAIASDDDGGDESDTTAVCAETPTCVQLKPSKQLSPPSKGILKRPSFACTTSADSGVSIISAQLGSLRSGESILFTQATAPAQRRGSKTAPRKRSAHIARKPTVHMHARKPSKKVH